MENSQKKQIFSIFNFNETSVDTALKFFNLKSLGESILKNNHEMTNLLTFMINTKHVLFEDSNWSLSSGKTLICYQIKELMNQISEFNSQYKIFEHTKVYGFNKLLRSLGDETSFQSSESIETLFRRICFNSRLNYCDLQKNLSQFYNEISTFRNTKLSLNGNFI
jgi:hypothetical protein